MELGDLLVTWRRRAGGGGSWRPLLAHLGACEQRTRAVKLRAERVIPDALGRQQIETLLDGCDRLRDRLLMMVMAEGGLRVGEALGLRHEDIDPAVASVAVIPRAGNSNHARAKGWSRQVPIPARVVRTYADYLHGEYGDLDCDYVFVNLWSRPVGRPLRYGTVYEMSGRLGRRTGVMFTPHTLRHSYATELLRRGVPVEVVQRLLGHASMATTSDTYAHLKIEDTRRALVAAGWLTGQEPHR